MGQAEEIGVTMVDEGGMNGHGMEGAKWEWGIGREGNDVRPFSRAATPASPAVLFAFSIVSFAVSVAVFLNGAVVVNERADGRNAVPAARVVRRRRDISVGC